MNRKILLVAVLTVFIIGMLCAFACEPVEAKKVVKIKKGKKYYTAKFKFKGKTYKAKLKKNKKDSKMYGDSVYDTTKKKGGHIFRLYHTTYSNGYDKIGWNFCKQRNTPYEGHLYYKIKWV